MSKNKATRRVHAPRARSIARRQSDTGIRQVDARVQTPDKGLRRPATRLRPPDMGVRRRQDADASTEADLNFEFSLDESRMQRRNIPDLWSHMDTMRRWGFKGHLNTNPVGPHRLGQYQGHSNNTQIGPHGLGQFKKGRVSIRGMGQTNKQGAVTKGLNEGSFNLAQRNGGFKGAQPELTEPSSGHTSEHGTHKMQPPVTSSECRVLTQNFASHGSPTVMFDASNWKGSSDD
ncbi:hypothetical protein F0562_008907 [Nyssa sinensis]|uniref:Uncharacterized protein n=1 Tax=Nyssa sinensis TaxID=561372 RepID=A0A5J5A6Y7_9ASTE|nr:hypothetical protein F0562_008907 [Nyssa sinensis]